MLQVFRRHAYSWGTRALLGLLVLVFIIFFGGLGSYFLQAKPIASVGCHTLLGVMTLPGCYNIYPNQVDEEVTNLRKILINRYGDNAPRTNTFEFRSLPSGTYEVKAILYGADGQPRAQARQQVNVIANGAGH